MSTAIMDAPEGSVKGAMVPRPLGIGIRVFPRVGAGLA